jgi:hypothetical protein
MLLEQLPLRCWTSIACKVTLKGHTQNKTLLILYQLDVSNHLDDLAEQHLATIILHWTEKYLRINNIE